MGRPPRHCWVCLRKTSARWLGNQVHTLSEDSWHDILRIWQCSPIHVALQERHIGFSRMSASKMA